eukprot:4314950-Pleurochrysis_carterae.AAC.4
MESKRNRRVWYNAWSSHAPDALEGCEHPGLDQLELNGHFPTRYKSKSAVIIGMERALGSRTELSRSQMAADTLPVLRSAEGDTQVASKHASAGPEHTLVLTRIIRLYMLEGGRFLYGSYVYVCLKVAKSSRGGKPAPAARVVQILMHIHGERRTEVEPGNLLRSLLQRNGRNSGTASNISTPTCKNQAGANETHVYDLVA